MTPHDEIEAALARLDGFNTYGRDKIHCAVNIPLDTPLAALIRETHAALEGMDQSGGDACGMPECPWCRQQPDYDGMLLHAHDCQLFKARDALLTLVRAINGAKP